MSLVVTLVNLVTPLILGAPPAPPPAAPAPPSAATEARGADARPDVGLRAGVLSGLGVDTVDTPNAAGDRDHYATAESQSQAAVDFRGGGSVVIVASTGAVILVVILLVLLL